jgi:hypothetical protein
MDHIKTTALLRGAAREYVAGSGDIVEFLKNKKTSYSCVQEPSTGNQYYFSLHLNAELDSAFKIPDSQATTHVLLNDDF